ncbi:RNA polymerase sigma factor [Dyadobacter sp. CY323]|uniref:RNA polymerase sigma factor n=1 Tax=Dyadobacter sp. CY323 TaxID=2907302 RepID=UPI001F1BE2F9|nr:sigma-70 family RNA polymerase sigma factor [Dyadobacter sp. CY323]MCE6989710.1 sigma-70 family RNA polymerase sigma factor [Dyadobacter sp. CY323]
MSKPDNLSLDDQVLWNAFRGGDENAFGEIARKYYKGLFSYGTRFSGDREFVKDCIQDLFFEMWTRRETLGDTDFVKFYLLKSLRRKIYRESNRKNWISEETDLEYITENIGDASIEQHIIEIESSEEKTQLINQLLQSLPKRQQEVIYLKFYEDLDNDSIAQVMSISKQAVANLIYRSIRELKDRI